MLTVIQTQTVPGNSGQTLLARIVGAGAVPITQATLASLSVVVTDLTKEANSPGSGSVATHAVTISQAIFNSLVQGDPQWTKDTVNNPGPDGQYGYNFLFTVPASDFAASGDTFQCDVVYAPVSGQPFRVKYVIKTEKVYG